MGCLPALGSPQGNEGSPRWASHLHPPPPQLPGMSCLRFDGKKVKDANAADTYSADFTQMPWEFPPSLLSGQRVLWPLLIHFY